MASRGRNKKVSGSIGNHRIKHAGTYSKKANKAAGQTMERAHEGRRGKKGSDMYGVCPPGKGSY